jgi:hypothetical protein
MAVVFKDCSHNIHLMLVGTIIEDGSMWSFTLNIWHNTQLHTWSFHISPSFPFNNNTLEFYTFLVGKMIHLVITSKIKGVVYYYRCNILIQMYSLEADNLFFISWHTTKYPKFWQWPNSPWPLGSQIETILFIDHILKAKHLDHQS